MSAHELPPIDPELDSLLAAERLHGPVMPRDAHDRVMTRLGATLGIAMVSMSAGSASAATLARMLLSKGLLIASGVLLGVAGGSVVAETAPAPIRAQLSHDVVVLSMPASIEEPAVQPASLPDEPAVAVSEPAAASGSASAVASRDHDLAAERALLEVARTALSRGQTASALAALGQHATRFRNGQLAEERESLWIQALVAAGRDKEARQRADGFRRRSPNSILLPGVDEVLKQSKPAPSAKARE